MSIDIAQTDATTNPAAGFGRLKARTNGSVTARDPAGVERDLGQPQGPVISAVVLSTDFTSGPLVPVTGLTVTIPAGKSASVMFIGRGTAASGLAENRTVGLRVIHGAGANGNVSGSVFGVLNIASAAAATALEDGDVINAAAGATVDFVITGSVAAAQQYGYLCSAVLKNNSTNASATVSALVAGNTGPSAVIGSAIHGVII